MSSNKKILINDSCILFDLVDLNLIDKFFADLSKSLQEKRNSAKSAFEIKEHKESSADTPSFDLEKILTSPIVSPDNSAPDKNYQYALGKIATKRNPADFDFFGGILRAKCQSNNLVLAELNHMEANISNDIEYYTSFRLICKELDED